MGLADHTSKRGHKQASDIICMYNPKTTLFPKGGNFIIHTPFQRKHELPLCDGLSCACGGVCPGAEETRDFI